jgi:uncharacterized damage-inducible protein DinB
MPLYGVRQMTSSMRAVHKNTIQVANDLPESKYPYRATPESRSVAELLVHIAWLWNVDRLIHDEEHIDSLEGFDFGAVLKESATEEKRQRSKAEIIDLLRTEGERWVRWVEQLPEMLLAEEIQLPGGMSVNRFEMILATKEHEIHHRAQLTVLERLAGVVPHFMPVGLG